VRRVRQRGAAGLVTCALACLLGCGGKQTGPTSVQAEGGAVRVPEKHRAAALLCPIGRGAGAAGPLPVSECRAPDGGVCWVGDTLSDGTLCGCGDLCAADVQCTQGTNGRCEVFVPPDVSKCSYDQCFSDSDCEGGVPCSCRPSPSDNAPNVCATGSRCNVDSDCGPGGYCSPNPAWFAVEYHCHTANDQCVDDSDCDGDADLFCAFDGGARLRTCTVLNAPP
jgi:hypothetical protein